ncbi:AcrR family transcriptional regulator [Streptosporangium becharense]|uniref:AcrR family transcriptional regulator n=1 Tax=Streptosporangium becharense TaxID=1816182 RepID=A0A7W9IJU3_9ACTN|nr:TetR family transcriptional regulator C-terminal domain-containing protein [Streptosporangium becharense]MBB2911016.1 AcrR family transcriptional regulator [Streptosporangium becharense]MBB5821926.1 AcrR family transcriptional regulator [Streptosporangium becharense]
MPVEIDINQRLATIADATLEIVAADGIDGVTIRAVARRIGGSTTLVTNYLPTREALLRNAVEHAIRSWAKEAEQSVEEVADRERRLSAMTRWACSTTGNDQVLRRLFMEILGRAGPESEALQVLREDARHSRDLLAAAARDAGAADAAFTADVLHLVLRGFYVSSLEDPERWDGERAAPLIERLVRLLTGVP